MVECSTSAATDFELTVKYVLLFLNIGTSLLAILGNGLVIITFYTYADLRTRSNYFLLFLSITDMAVGLVVQPMTCLLIIGLKLCIGRVLLIFFSAFSCGSSFGILTVISYDRYLHLSKLKNYNKYMTNKKCKTLVLLVFVYNVLTGSLLFKNDTRKIFYYCCLVSSVVCNVTICFCYYKSWKMVKTKTIPTTNIAITKHWRVIKSMGLIVLFSVGSWLPFSIYGIIIKNIFQVMNIDFETAYYPENEIIFFFCLWFGYANSSINPVLYYWRNRKIRRGMQCLIIGKLGRKDIKFNFPSISRRTVSVNAANTM